jgi:hypothetical protein
MTRRKTVAQSFHADDRPAVLASDLQRLLGTAGVVELALAVVMQQEQPEGRLVRAGRRYKRVPPACVGRRDGRSRAVQLCLGLLADWVSAVNRKLTPVTLYR